VKRIFASRLLLVVVLALATFAGLTCEPNEEDVYIELSITRQPVGGSGVDTVWCTFKGTSFNVGGKEGDLYATIKVNGYWMSSHGVYDDKYYYWTQHNQSQTFTSFKAAPEGMYLDKPFWYVLRVTDKNGFREITSDTAYCE
jgi:hypothetical protein